MIHVQDKDHNRPYRVSWNDESYLKIIIKPTKVRAIEFFQISQVILSMANVDYKMFDYSKTTFAIPPNWKSQFVQRGLMENLLMNLWKS